MNIHISGWLKKTDEEPSMIWSLNFAIQVETWGRDLNVVYSIVLHIYKNLLFGIGSYDISKSNVDKGKSCFARTNLPSRNWLYACGF
jgi:hypothetical protein